MTTRPRLLALFTFLLFTFNLHAQIDTLRIATYNALNFPGTNWEERKPYFQKIIKAMEPDILALQEVNDQAGVDSFRVAVLNQHHPERFASATFIDDGALNSALFFDASTFTLKSTRAINLDSRDVIEYVLNYTNASGDPDIYIYSAHLSAGSGTDDRADRAVECRILRDELNALPTGANFFMLGDFNFYTQSEAGFHTLIDSEADDDGRCFDPIDSPAVWHDKETYAFLHTQCPRKERFGGGAYGGLDDRFDFIFTSAALLDNTEYYYMPGSYQAFGNDGNHFNISINDGANAAVSMDVADALYFASDHLPVCLDVVVDLSPLPIELNGFFARVMDNTIILSWQTTSESNNYGFHIERSRDAVEWHKIGFIPGNGTTTIESRYSFTDEHAPHGRSFYRLKQIDADGSFTFSDEISISVNLVSGFKLASNYPNPFNNSTLIEYELPREKYTELCIYNILGHKIKSLVHGTANAGVHQVRWDGTNEDGDVVKSGLYIYMMRSGQFEQSRKLLLVK